MPRTPKSPTPEAQAASDEIDAQLDLIRQALYDVAFHDEPLTEELRDEVEGGAQAALLAALAERQRRQSRALPGRFVVSVKDVVARALKTLRTAADLTQEGLAGLMRDHLGFVAWQRITVAEAESGKRRLSVEEMMGVAALFDVPVGMLLGSLESDEVLAMNERVRLTAAQAQELCTGLSGEQSWLGVRLQATSTGEALISMSADTRPAHYVWEAAVDGGVAQVLRAMPMTDRPVE